MGLLDDITSYLAKPTAPEDQGRDFQSLSDRAESLVSDLEEVRHLLTSADDAPSSDVLTALEDVEQFVVVVQARTFMKHVDNPEPGLIELRTCLSRAKSGT